MDSKEIKKSRGRPLGAKNDPKYREAHVIRKLMPLLGDLEPGQRKRVIDWVNAMWPEVKAKE
jgi:hypothetical protein